jgi:hypothetical protein
VDEPERFLGVAGYRPHHVHTVGELSDHRERLRSLVGRTFTGSVAMWDTADDEWFIDGPLILRFEEVRLELAAFKIHMCVSWNSIDLDREIEWSPGSTFELAWREGALPALEALRGRSVDEVSVVEYRGGFNGLAFRAGDAYAEVYNALDELGLKDTIEPDAEVTRTPV